MVVFGSREKEKGKFFEVIIINMSEMMINDQVVGIYAFDFLL